MQSVNAVNSQKKKNTNKRDARAFHYSLNELLVIHITTSLNVFY